MSESQKKEKHYKVVKGTVGPFPKDHVFSESEFAKLHPEPSDEKDKRDYHSSLIGRLRQIGAITETDDDAAPTPPGPHTAGSATVAQSIASSTAETMSAVKFREQLKQGDLTQAKKTD